MNIVGAILSRTFSVPHHDLGRVLFHASILCFVLCGFWLLDALKDPVLAAIVGIEYQPMAKVLSVLVTFIVVCMYDYLTSTVTKSSLFHIVSFSFGTIFFIIAAMLSDPIRGLDNHHKSSSRLLGWLSYFAIEAYGSLMVALFWSFTNSIMDLEQAKGAYGLIISSAQVGAILGSTLATQSSQLGLPQLYLLGALSVFCVSLLIKLYHIIFREDRSSSIMDTRVRSTTESSVDESPPPLAQGPVERLAVLFEGLTLIGRHRYVMLLLIVTCLYEIVITILDFEFKVLGAQYSSSGEGEGEGNANFVILLGHFGQVTNLLSLLVALAGFSFLVQRLGVRLTLLIFPVTLFLAVLLTNLVPSFWLLFVLVSVLKAIDYSLYDPVVELLFIPTSEPIKFKAKAWIDVFGARLAKAVGSVVTHLSAGDVSRLRTLAEVPMLLISLLLIAAAAVVGRDFEGLVRRDEVVGEDPGEAALRRQSNILEHKHNSFSESERCRGENELPVRNGLKPGEVGYDGYDLALYSFGIDTDGDDVFPVE